jgi:hypothetical protein
MGFNPPLFSIYLIYSFDKIYVMVVKFASLLSKLGQHAIQLVTWGMTLLALVIATMTTAM